MNIGNLIMHLLEFEDKKNPYTDEEIAAKLNIYREIVTDFRKKNNIDNSRNRRLKYIKNDALKILKNDTNISDRIQS